MKGTRRRRGAEETDRQRLSRACARHLRDLKRAHVRPPPDLALPQSRHPLRIEPTPVSSFCTSPSELCAELMS